MHRKWIFPGTLVFMVFGLLLLGIAHISMLPPWEGFDEAAHYSYIQQVADTYKLPRHGTARMSEDVEKYILYAPISYSSIPPFEQNGGFTYKSFFDNTAEFIANGKDYVHKKPADMRHYTQGKGFNWQAQHPPLYYLLLSPVYLATRGLSWGKQLFILRLISYLFAWSALIFALYSCFSFLRLDPMNASKSLHYWAMLGICSWPILFPSWFPEMARLGNDSLCALIVAVIWFITVRALNNGLSIRYSAILGILLGFGCLTKAFFIPVAIGILAFWGVRKLRFAGKEGLKHILFHMSLIVLIIVCIAGWWYIRNWYQQGVLLGTDEIIALRNAGGLINGLIENFSFKAWLRGHATFITTFGWCGTWSLARPPYILLAPMAIIVIFVVVTYISALPRFKATGMGWLPTWITMPLILGFSYHVLIRIALTGEGKGTGGYYMHFLVVPMGVALGLGFSAWWIHKSFRKIVVILLLYAILFSIVTTWAQILLFSGILFKAGTNKFFQFPLALPSLFGIPDALNRLKVLAFPVTGIITWISGGIMVMIGLILTWKSNNLLSIKIEK